MIPCRPIHFMFTYSAILIAGCTLETPVECVNGQNKCTPQSSLTNSIAASCGTDQKWHMYACPDKCNAEETDCQTLTEIPGCTKNGEQKCENTQSFSISFTCINQKWIPEPCGKEVMCSGHQCNDSINCEEGAEFCTYIKTLDVAISAKCKDGQWVSQYCPAGTTCDGQSCGILKDDVTQCGSAKINCSSTIAGWANGICNHGQCEARECTTGYHLYENSCEVNDETNCGTHGNKCSTEQFANSKTVSCNTGSCLITECNDGYLLSDNQCQKNDCTTNNEEKCFNANNIGSMYKCVNNEWQKQEDCPNGYSCNANQTACGNCQDTSTKCEDTGNIGSVFTCQSGEWGNEPVSCENTSCHENACGECKNTDTKCIDDSTTLKGTKYTCTAGSWGTETACGENSCYHKTCGSCLNNSTRCNTKSDLASDTIQTCINGAFSTESKCTTSVSNAIGACADSTSCGSFKCIIPHALTMDSSNDSCIATSCDSGYEICNDTCIDKLTDNDNCGSCGNKCSDLFICIDGSCTDAPTCGDGNYYKALKYIHPATSEETDVNAFCINSVAMFNRVRDAINKGEHFPSENIANAYVLTSDLPLDPLTFIPIGNETNPCSGYFFGDNKTISIDSDNIRVTSNNYGLFGVMKDSYIQDLTLKIKLQSHEPYDNIGGLGGQLRNSHIDNVSVESTIAAFSGLSIGGLFGDFSYGSLSHSNVTVHLSNTSKSNYGGDTNIGGIAGNMTDGVFTETYSTGEMSTPSQRGIGGFIGHMRGGSISNCYSTIDVNGSSNTAGFVGTLSGGTISDSYATGNASGSVGIGGFIGAGSGHITNCYSTGDVKATNQAGGFWGVVGINSSMNRCGAFGLLKATGDNLGGLGGQVIDSVTDCYALNTVSTGSNKYNIGGLVGQCQKSLTLKNSYSLSTLPHPNYTWGNLVAAILEPSIIQNSYYNNSSGVALEHGIDKVSPLEINPVVIKEDTDGIDTIYATDGSTPLATVLGSNWKMMICTVDIGQGKKQYKVPISTSITPDFCHDQLW